MSRFQKFCLVSLSGFLLALACLPASAVDVKDKAMGQVKSAAKTAELGDAPAPQMLVVGIIRILLAVTGAIFVALTFYGGYKFITAHGAEEKAEEGKKIIEAAVIGLVIVFLAYSITLFIGARINPLVTEGGVIQK